MFVATGALAGGSSTTTTKTATTPISKRFAMLFDMDTRLLQTQSGATLFTSSVKQELSLTTKADLADVVIIDNPLAVGGQVSLKAVVTWRGATLDAVNTAVKSYTDDTNRWIIWRALPT